MSKRRKWLFEERLAILKEAEQVGVTATIRKYGLYYATFYNWKSKFETDGEAGLKADYKRIAPEMKQLRLENIRLKQMVADKELALQIKDEMLKKNLYRERKKL